MKIVSVHYESGRMEILPEVTVYGYLCVQDKPRRSQWPRGLKRRSAAGRLQGLWVRIPPGAWMFVLYSVCVVR
jgi:hypothetical protein